jgi:3-oxoacyl-[acyl-carrier-protein] synthase II
MQTRVVITGMGIISPIGNNIKDFWDSNCKGKNGAGRITRFDPSPYECQVAAEVKDFDPAKYISPKEAKRSARFCQYAIAAAKEAVADSGLDINKEDPYRIGVFVGSGIGGLDIIEEQHNVLLQKGPSRMSVFTIPMLITNMAPGQVSIYFGFKGPNLCVSTACATGSHAIGEAYDALRLGEADVMIAGGSEGAIVPTAIGGFCACRALTSRNDNPLKASRPFDKERDGFLMGEGAGILVLETLDHAKKRGAKIYAEIVGYGANGDAYHMTAPSPDGDAAVRCMQSAIAGAKLNPSDITYINAHGTSTAMNDKLETAAIKRVFGENAYKIPISSTKSMTGHMLGAAGAAELIACILAINNNIIPPTINYEIPDPECDLDYVPNTAREAKVNTALSNSLGFGGHNATLVVKRFE